MLILHKMLQQHKNCHNKINECELCKLVNIKL